MERPQNIQVKSLKYSKEAKFFLMSFELSSSPTRSANVGEGSTCHTEREERLREREER
jgi:hypothetical protein